jgi:hypothetical protein
LFPANKNELPNCSRRRLKTGPLNDIFNGLIAACNTNSLSDASAMRYLVSDGG